MIVHRLPERIVEFCATSPRVAKAYRMAAKVNRRLASVAVFCDWSTRIPSAVDVKKPLQLQRVVLSFADDDSAQLVTPQLKPLFSGAFNLLISSPKTSPDQISQWSHAVKLRSENDMYAVSLVDLTTSELPQLLGRVCNAHRQNSDCIIGAYLNADSLCIRGPMHRKLLVPLSKIPSLNGKPASAVRKFTLDPDGSYIYWPDLDVHLGWHQLLQAVEPDALLKAQQKSDAFNKRYGAAIRVFRESSGIRQSNVPGLTERQLRRIEHGECRATSAALAALAKAHKLLANVYLERLAIAVVA